MERKNRLTLISEIGSLLVLSSVGFGRLVEDTLSVTVCPSRRGSVNCSNILFERSDLVFAFSDLLLFSFSLP